MISTRFTGRWHGNEAARYSAAAKSGDASVAGVLVGEAAGLIADTPPAADILARVSAEAETLLAMKAPSYVTD